MSGRILLLACGLAAVSLISGLSAWLTTRVVEAGTMREAPDYHQWIHQELKLTEVQEKELLPSERRYEDRRRHLEEVIRVANAELAEAIQQDRAYSPRVEAAVQQIEAAMGQLQRATLEHIFEMKGHLEPEQYDRLMALTVEGLSENIGRK